MTIETIKGIFGFKIGMFELLRILLKYQFKSELVKSLRKTYENLEDLCDDVKERKWIKMYYLIFLMT